MPANGLRSRGITSLEELGAIHIVIRDVTECLTVLSEYRLHVLHAFHMPKN